MPVASADDVAQLIEAFADLLWPVLVFVAIVMFRSELAALSKRITKLRVPGAEAELDQALDKLQVSAEEAEEATPPRPADRQPKAITVGPGVETDEALPITAATTEAVEDEAGRILDRASNSPRAALMLLAADVERKSREVLSTRGPDAMRAPFHRQLQLMEVSPAVQEAALQFRDVRNRIVHGGVASEEETLRAIDAGLSILRALGRIPHEVNVVIEPKVKCYADAEGKLEHDFEAVLLGAEHPPDGEFQKRAFPYTGPPLPKEEPITWEWKSGGRVFPEAWYHDPATDQLEYGWTSALEFAGRPLPPGQLTNPFWLLTERTR